MRIKIDVKDETELLTRIQKMDIASENCVYRFKAVYKMVEVD